MSIFFPGYRLLRGSSESFRCDGPLAAAPAHQYAPARPHAAFASHARESGSGADLLRSVECRLCNQ